MYFFYPNLFHSGGVSGISLISVLFLGGGKVGWYFLSDAGLVALKSGLVLAGLRVARCAVDGWASRPAELEGLTPGFLRCEQ